MQKQYLDLFLNVKPIMVDDPMPESRPKSCTVVPDDISLSIVRDEDVTCPSFVCSMDDNQICRNSFSLEEGHPCIKQNCPFVGDCYLCEREFCDDKGKYTCRRAV